tara:strand:+ start:220 stop:1335 length:1116 start_codon:yes stop_codon:yes gene_type:complete
MSIAKIGNYSYNRLEHIIRIVAKDVIENSERSPADGGSGISNPPIKTTEEPIGEGYVGAIPVGTIADLVIQDPAAASITFNFPSDAVESGDILELTSADGTHIKYKAVDPGEGTTGSEVGDYVTFVLNPWANGIYRGGYVAYELRTAILGSTGHDGKISVNNVSDWRDPSLTFTQNTEGDAGNTDVVNSLSGVMTVPPSPSPRFSGGRDGDAYVVFGELTVLGTAEVTEKHQNRVGFGRDLKTDGQDLLMRNELSDGDIRMESTRDILLTSTRDITLRSGEGEDILLIPGDGGNTTVGDGTDMLPAVHGNSDLGSETKKFGSVYSTDAHLSDLHLKNERGDWTIIEEEEYLTMRNNNTGQRYKILMEPLDE